VLAASLLRVARSINVRFWGKADVAQISETEDDRHAEKHG
jgi:hypothetical protein